MDPQALSPAVVVRRLAAADVEAVIELSLRAWAPVFASFAQVLGKKIYDRLYPDWQTGQARAVRDTCAGDHVFVADLAGAVVGFSAVVVRDDDPKTGEIDMLAVDPRHQRQGVGSALITHSVDHLRSAGVVLVDVATGGDPAHAPARHAYEKAGFTPLPLVRYYQAV